MTRKPIQLLRKILHRLKPGGTLSQQAARSGVWAFGMNISKRGLYILMLVTAARLLGPAAIGVYTAGLIATAGLKHFTRLGVREALVQREDRNVNEFLDTAWMIQIGRGVAIFTVLVVLAPVVARFFSEPELAVILPAMALGKFVILLRNPAVVYLQKHLEFDKGFVYKVGGSLTQFILGVTLAYLWGTVWALVVAYLGDKIARTALSFVLWPYRPSLEFDRAKAKEIIDYGKWITGQSILFFLYDRGDDAFVGWLLASTALGWYSLAYRLSNAPSTEVSKVLSQVLFPTFSHLQDDMTALREAFFKSLRIASVVAFPLAFGLIAVAPTFVTVVLGTDWEPMIVPMQILAVYGLLEIMAKPVRQVWKAIGQPDYNTKVSAVRVIVTAVLIYPATAAMGITGTALVIVAAYLVTVAPLQLYLITRNLHVSYSRFALEVGYPIVASATMLAGVVAIRDTIPMSSSAPKLVLLIVAGACVYALSVAALVAGFNWKIKNDIDDIVQSLAN